MDNFDHILQLVTVIMSLTAIIPVGLFIYYYGSKAIPGHKWKRAYSSAWRMTTIGRTMMQQKIAWFVLLLYSTFAIFFPTFPGRSELRFVIYTSLLFLFWKMFIALRTTQKSGVESVDAVHPEETHAERQANRDRNGGEYVPSTGSVPAQRNPQEQ